MYEDNLQKLHDSIDYVNNILKELEQRHKTEGGIKLSDREFRFTCCHFSRAIKNQLSTGNSHEFNFQIKEAISHCEKAMNHGLKFGIESCISDIEVLGKTYTGIISEVFRRYESILSDVFSAKEFVAINDLSRSCEKYKKHYDAVYAGKAALYGFQEELNKRLLAHKKRQRAQLFSLVLTAIIAIATVAGVADKIYTDFHNEKHDNVNMVARQPKEISKH